MTNPNSYQLFLSPRSPFARRIRLALRRLQLPVEEKIINVFEDHPDLLAVNPLGMVPAVRSPEGENWIDSGAILETLDDLSGAIWPKDLSDRVRIRQAATLASGLIQGCISYFLETKMHQPPSPMWAQDHLETIERSLGRMLNSPEACWIRGDELTQAGWDFAVGIDYLELRIPMIQLHRGHPLVERIMGIANQDSNFTETKPLA